MNKVITTKRAELISFILIIGIMLWKGIPYWDEPRIWAEEGTIYLKSAFENGWKTMFMPQVGYYALIPSVVTYLVTWLPLIDIPMYTQLFSFLFWLVPFILIIGLNKAEYTGRIKGYLCLSLIFIFLSREEVFLNTINLQFITPIILLISVLYDESKLSKYQIIALRVLQIICLLNGVLGLVFMPYLLYRALYVDKKKDLFFFIYILSIAFHIGMVLSYQGEGNTLYRIKWNYEFLLKDLEISIIRLIANRKVYLVFLIIAIISLVKLYFDKEKSKNIVIERIALLISCGLLILFIDFTKTPKTIIFYRYIVLIYAVLYYVLLTTLIKNRFYITVISSIVYLSFVFIYSRAEEFGYCNTCPKWSEEYKKMDKKQKMIIHPVGWEIELDYNKVK